MRTLLIDDERLARVRLRSLLSTHPDFEVVGEADSIASALEAIDELKPELLFLDISMPGGSGFELFARRRVEAAVVFVTAFDAHAIRAFEVGAVDYLLKPIEPERFEACLERLRSRPRPADERDRLALSDGRAMRLVEVGEIAMIGALGDYSEVLLRDGQRLVQKHTLAFWEERVGQALFRVHRSALVALDAIERVERAEGSASKLFLHGEQREVPVSRSRVSALKAALRGLDGSGQS